MSTTATSRTARPAPLAWIADQWRRSDWMTYVITFIVTTVATITSHELWNAKLNVPFNYTGDAIPTGAHFKTVAEQGWYEYQPLLGAPTGQTYHDFPTADNLNFMFARVLGFVTPDWPTAMNLYYLLGFPLAALAAVWLVRRLSISRTFSVVLGTLFALAPYHFIRGEGHLWLSSYFVIPLSIAVVMDVIQGKPIWGLREGGPRWLRWASRRTVLTLAILALTGTAQSYYAIFFLVLLAFAGIVRLIRSGEWGRFWGAAISGGVAVIVMLINMSPDMIYSLVNGANPAGFARGHIEAEIYALKLTQLLLPWPGHRIGFLRSIREQYDAHYPLISESPALGAAAALGLVALFLILAFMAATWGGRRARTLTATPQFQVLGQLAALTFVAFLFSTVGGLSTLISFVTTALRGWNRMSIVIALLCLAAVGILLDAMVRAIQRRIPRLGVRRAFTWGLAGVLLVAGYVDQTPPDYSASFPATIERFEGDSTWFAEVEASVPAGSMIVQLPYEPFPESLGPTGVLGSEALIPYLHTQDIRWTAGGIKGRPTADWTAVLETLDPADIARFAAATGAAGIHLDLPALTDEQRTALQSGLDDAIGEHTDSDDGRWAFYPLDGVRAELENEFSADELTEFSRLITDPVTITSSPSFNPELDEDGQLQYRAASLEPFVTLSSAADTGSRVEVDLEVRVEDPGADGVEFTLPDGTVRTIDIVDGIVSANVTFEAAPGLSDVQLRVVGAPVAANAALVLTRLTVFETALTPLLAR